MRSLFFFLFLITSIALPAQRRFQFTQGKMGSPFNLVFYAADSARAERLAAQAYFLVDSLNAIFSDYDSTSEVARLSRTAGTQTAVSLSPPLFHLLRKSAQAAADSRGAFDITIGALSQLWRGARRARTFPSREAVQEARNKTGMQYLLLDTNAKTANLLQPGMRLDFGGIAKGYAAQQVVAFLRDSGIQSALADAGGDVACTAPPPGKPGWKIGVNVPESGTNLLPQTLLTANEAVATSGDVYQYIEHNGKKYSHIVDPRTGHGVHYLRNVTVLANDGATADWLATACSILAPGQARKLVKKYGAHLLITTLRNGRVAYFTSPGMKRRLEK